MIQDFLEVWNLDRVKFRNTGAMMANESAGVLETMMQEAVEKFRFRLGEVLEKSVMPVVVTAGSSASLMGNSSVGSSVVTSVLSVADTSNLQIVELLPVSVAERVTLEESVAVSSVDSSVSSIAEPLTDIISQGAVVQCSEEASRGVEELNTETEIYTVSVSEETGVCSIAAKGDALAVAMSTLQCEFNEHCGHSVRSDTAKSKVVLLPVSELSKSVQFDNLDCKTCWENRELGCVNLFDVTVDTAAVAKSSFENQGRAGCFEVLSRSLSETVVCEVDGSFNRNVVDIHVSLSDQALQRGVDVVDFEYVNSNLGRVMTEVQSELLESEIRWLGVRYTSEKCLQEECVSDVEATVDVPHATVLGKSFRDFGGALEIKSAAIGADKESKSSEWSDVVNCSVVQAVVDQLFRELGMTVDTVQEFHVFEEKGVFPSVSVCVKDMSLSRIVFFVGASIRDVKCIDTVDTVGEETMSTSSFAKEVCRGFVFTEFKDSFLGGRFKSLEEFVEVIQPEPPPSQLANTEDHLDLNRSTLFCFSCVINTIKVFRESMDVCSSYYSLVCYAVAVQRNYNDYLLEASILAEEYGLGRVVSVEAVYSFYLTVLRAVFNSLLSFLWSAVSHISNGKSKILNGEFDDGVLRDFDFIRATSVTKLVLDTKQCQPQVHGM